jgi:hypothetical protein
MATAGVPSGTILAVHLQKCSHLSNFQYNKTINASTCGEHHNCSPYYILIYMIDFDWIKLVM